MPRSTSRINVDEEKLIELVRVNPELYDPKHEFANQVSVKNCIWENIATQLDAPEDLCKKVWNKLKDQHAKEKKSKSDRRKSLRSCNSEKYLAFLDFSSGGENSNENSRASSNCGSPKREEKRRLRSSSRSLSQLSAISESDLASITSTSNADTIEANDNSLMSAKTVSQSAGRTPRKLKFPSDVNSGEADDRFQVQPQPSERNLRPRLSEPSYLTSKEMLQNAVNSTPRRQSGGANGRKLKKSPVPSDSTRAFFESMALTVSAFPQHVQAAMKLRICNIVSETEYELSSPKIR